MTSAWRAAGLTYLRYSQVAAQTLRKCLQTDKREEIMKHVGKLTLCRKVRMRRDFVNALSLTEFRGSMLKR